MGENIRSRSLAGGSQSSHTPAGRRRAMRASPESVDRLLEWIHHAQTIDSAWILEFLLLVGFLVALLLSASGIGLLPNG